VYTLYLLGFICCLVLENIIFLLYQTEKMGTFISWYLMGFLRNTFVYNNEQEVMVKFVLFFTGLYLEVIVSFQDFATVTRANIAY